MAAAESAETAQLQQLLALLQSGDPQARNDLLARVSRRMERLTRHMLCDYPQVRRWEETADVLNAALLRLHRALGVVKLDSLRHFLHLAAVEIRRELLDLARRHNGPEGLAANHHTDDIPSDNVGGMLAKQQQPEGEPGDLDAWSNFHEAVAKLPEDAREVVSLIWYQGFSQEEVAGVLEVNVRTVKRRWAAARVLLGQVLQGNTPR